MKIQLYLGKQKRCKDGSNRVTFRCTIENVPLNDDGIMPSMLDNETSYTWTYTSNTTDYYTAVYTSEGKLQYDSKVRGARRLTLRLSGAKKQ